ncbi:unnamed protein product [Caenorhabditis auriculariae]|uniref:Septin and tuftelin-interacting protein 1 homolog n=1 Tax=Caenorhabditis auriculariae TaxID=2777116 RepID=A0A8S1HUQ1_9PELO|nr:unnamed protein product [Caenorhabditis auriculariae]
MAFGQKDDSDEEDDGRPSFGKRKKNNYTTAVNFVSGGIQKDSSIKIDKDDPESLKAGTFSSNIEYEEVNFSKKSKKKPKEMGAQVFAGMRSSSSSGAMDTNTFGGWLKHGKGSVVSKMMEAMGYKPGQGLGATGQGIVEPVTAAVRKGRGAIGAYGKEATGPKFGESAADAQKRLAEGKSGPGDDEESSKYISLPKGGWKKTQSVKTRYRTLEDVLEEGTTAASNIARTSASHSNIKVIDMTGPQQRVYTGYDSFSMKTKAEYVDTGDRDTFDVPELMHNINLLIDLTEESIRRNDHQLRSIKDQSTALEYDMKKLNEVLEGEELEEKRLKEVYFLIESFSAQSSSGARTMVEYQELFLKLRAQFPTEYRLYNLESIAIPYVLPMLLQYFSKWRPLDPDHVIYGIELMREWREILVDSDSKTTFGMNKGRNDEIAAYDRLLWEGWLPSLRRAALDWDPRDQMEDMLNLIETWIPVLPAWIKENILEQVIVPRIGERVNEWDPTKDTVPIHSWLVPWLHVLGDRIQGVMPPIRQKLSKALKLWDPKDRSAIAILRPWKEVWAPGTLTAFLANNIVPKLARALEDMELDPRINPQYEEWAAVMDWLELIHPEAIVGVVIKCFFPRFHETLCIWLDSPGANVAEVKMWFREWQMRIPADISQFPVIKESLRRSLIAIGQSLEGVRVSNQPQMPMQPINSMSAPLAPPIHQPSTQQLSLKDAIEMTAARHGFTYHPQKDRFKDGRQVFWFGAVSIFIDRGMVYVMDPIEFIWRPTGLDELIRLGQGVNV